MATNRPSTPPPARAPAIPSTTQLTPEQVRRTEMSRLKAKALRAQAEAEATRNGTAPTTGRTPSGFIVPSAAGQKRPHPQSATAPASRTEPTVRDARQSGNGAPAAISKDGGIETARKFQNYIDYDFSKMTDTHGGFLTADDDPHNKALHKPDRGGPGEEKPAHMTVREWERHQLLRKLRAQKAGPFEPGINAMDAQEKATKGCEHCGSLELDWQFQEVFGVRICNRCKEERPERYSLLTKTEAKEDYLLTDPELKDEELLPRLEKPNPHKMEWNNMHLFLRFQVEAYAFSERKWGTPDKLDEEFERRQREKKRRKEEKFRSKLEELKKRTRVEAYKRGRERERMGGGPEAQFGDRVGNKDEDHEHEWGRAVIDAEGVSQKTCIQCGMKVEELEF